MDEKHIRVVAGGKKRRCRYGAECRSRNCKFQHPSPGANKNNDVKKSNPKYTEKNAAPTRDRSKIQCRYGMECRNTKCPFFHHPAGAPVSSPTSPTRVISPVTNGNIPLESAPHSSEIGRNGHNLSSTDAKFSSPPSNSDGRALNAATTPSRKATTKKKCRWGNGCRNKKCTFLHPGQQFDRDAAQTPRRKASANAVEGMDLLLKSPALSNKAKPSNGTKAKVSVRQFSHPILPPSPETQEPPERVQCTSYPTGLLPPPDSEVRSPFQTSMPIDRTKTSEAMSRLLFSPVSNAPTSGFQGEGSRERTPLYSKTSAFCNPHPLNAGITHGGLEKHAQFCQPTGDAVKENHPVITSQDQPPDADWLFEVLGLNDLDVNDTAATQLRKTAIEDVVEQPFTATTSISANASVNYPPSDEQMHPKPKSEIPHIGSSTPTVSEKPSKKLIPEDEIVQSRSVALELRLESQHNSNNAESLFDLLQQCRSKQEMIKTALERSMDSPEGSETDSELDETNIVALLELNELLVGAINVAESSLHMEISGGEEEGGVTKVTASNSSREEKEGVSKREGDSSWKPVEKKASTTSKSVLKKNKAAENTDKSNKLKKMSLQPLQSAKNIENKNQKQEAKPDSPKSESSVDESASSPTNDSADAAQREKEKMARMLEEARKQAAAARERKKSKKNKKFDRWLKQNEEARENRAKTWAEHISKENDYIDLIGKLLVAELLRQSKNKAMGLTAERVLSDSHASEVIAEECRNAYGIIFGGLKCRVVVAGSENRDMNGRQGTIRYWDREKEKFCVGLDTKKSPDSDIQFLTPETLDVLASSRPPKADKKSTATSCDIHAPDLLSYGGVSLGFSFTLQKSHVIALGSADSIKIGLEVFCKSRDKEERIQKMEEEAEKKREEEDRKRRAARRAKENAAWEKRKEQMRRDKEDYEQMKKEWAKSRHGRGASMFDFYDDEDEEGCQCPRCRFGDRFSSNGGSFFFNIGGIPFRVRFDDYDSEEDSFFDEFDERWEEQLAEEKEEENRKQAEVLGIEPDADARTIKLAYRKMALQFHPDKWKSDSEHGMSRKEAEDRFKAVQAAYDYMMSNFDD
eukprot:CAMPEP_0172554698 /NCGR_PEP_ID=MMETSP1067-20121228/56010_1 /TAXON_ID=265564 ORGANISM="Thalassiosira punctigera, Strain Tpunct2005C2" /NCGR_SAMPLE_ID=MMETSP1067 /ASSEMBLY_ACC=CAM_ASM_000444 /LENGTH=1090 /DNA_ID=CAMNT_0013343123 /DNA_START=277 /DNA_END=3549 /DNA_ORIENTATION=+